ncbi:MAG: triose-phosphate isomerase [Hyphomicrobiales bacterium]
MPRNTLKPLVVGNWKMNGAVMARDNVRSMVSMLASMTPECDIMICPPATLIAPLCDVLARTGIAVGGQDCHTKSSGAHTGDVSAPLLRAAGAVAVILGHSERRLGHGEDNAMIRAKVAAAHNAGLTAILCLGETLHEYEAGRTEDVVAHQLAASLPDGADCANTVIAYEPVWAIGGGRIPEPRAIGAVHQSLRAALSNRFSARQAERMRILYGGSVTAKNAGEILSLPQVNGVLVGSASLRAGDFVDIIKASRKLKGIRAKGGLQPGAIRAKASS